MSHAVRLPCDEGAIRSGHGIAAPARAAGPRVLAAAILGSSLAFIDGTVVSVALPAIAREFRATGVEVQWVVEAYALLLSALLLVGGSLGDRFGRRRVYALGVAVFTLASIACGSLLTELIHGKTIAEARAITRQQIVEAVGGLPRESLHASHLAMDALAAVLLKLNP